MPHKTFPQPSARTFNVAELVGLAAEGKVRIPNFQRPLRWKWEDVRRLFDSISKGYPVGSLLLWKRPVSAGVVQFGKLRIDSPAHADSLWVVDGQQRLTSLANALRDEGLRSEDFAIAYDMNEEEFVRPPKTSVGTIVPLPVLFDLERLLEWAQEHQLGPRLKEASAVTSAIRQFSIPAYIVEQQDEAVLRDIFDRMNNYGKRLSRAEVFAALHPGTEDSASGIGFPRIIEEIESDLHFGRCEDDTVLRAVLARRGPDVTREIRDEFGKAKAYRDFGNESEQTAYSEGGAALKRAVSFLQEVGVPHLALLPYRYLLIVLTRVFAHFPEPHPRNCDLLRRWFWRTTLTPPTSYGGWNPAMRMFGSLVKAREEDESIQRLLNATNEKKTTAKLPDVKRFRTNQADSRVALCALWDLKPLSPSDGSPYSRQDLAEELGVDASPSQAVSSLLTFVPKDMAAWLASRHILLAAEPGRRGSSLFEVADGPDGSHQAILKSHCMNISLLERLRRIEEGRAPSLDIEREIFLRDRDTLVAEVVRDFVSRSAAWELEDTPPLDHFDLDQDDDDISP
jgi:uncharacterized protein DUF262